MLWSGLWLTKVHMDEIHHQQNWDSIKEHSILWSFWSFRAKFVHHMPHPQLPSPPVSVSCTESLGANLRLDRPSCPLPQQRNSAQPRVSSLQAPRISLGDNANKEWSPQDRCCLSVLGLPQCESELWHCRASRVCVDSVKMTVPRAAIHSDICRHICHSNPTQIRLSLKNVNRHFASGEFVHCHVSE